MRIYPLSDKAEQALFESTARITIFQGAVRASKTFITCVRWLDFILREADPNGLFCIAGQSIGNVEKNLISLLSELAGHENIKYSRAKNELYIYGRKHLICGCTDISSSDKLQGLTLAGSIMDEVVLFNKQFVDMMLTRLSVDGAKTFWTCNPASPYNFIKTEYVDRVDEINEAQGGNGIKVFAFTMDDNLSLSEEYKQSLKSTLRGVFYDRLVLGLWCNTAGRVYDGFFDGDVIDRDEQSETFGKVLYPSHIVNANKILASQGRRRFRHYAVGIDYGVQNATTYIMVGYDDYFSPKYVVKEYFYSGREENRQKTTAEMAGDFVKFIQGYNVTGIYIDPSAAALKVDLQRSGIYTTNSINDVIPGIATVSTMLAGYNLLIDESCVNLRREFAEYSWDEKRAEKGEDVPLPVQDHCQDALRYCLHTLFGQNGFLGIQGGGNRK